MFIFKLVISNCGQQKTFCSFFNFYNFGFKQKEAAGHGYKTGYKQIQLALIIHLQTWLFLLALVSILICMTVLYTIALHIIFLLSPADQLFSPSLLTEMNHDCKVFFQLGASWLLFLTAICAWKAGTLFFRHEDDASLKNTCLISQCVVSSIFSCATNADCHIAIIARFNAKMALAPLLPYLIYVK